MLLTISDHNDIKVLCQNLASTYLNYIPRVVSVIFLLALKHILGNTLLNYIDSVFQYQKSVYFVKQPVYSYGKCCLEKKDK